MGSRLEKFWSSWAGTMVLFMIVAAIWGSIHFFYPGGAVAFIKSGSTFNLIGESPEVDFSHHHAGTFVIDRVGDGEPFKHSNYTSVERIAMLNLDSAKIDTVRLRDGKYAVSYLDYKNRPCVHEWVVIKNGKKIEEFGFLGGCGQ